MLMCQYSASVVQSCRSILFGCSLEGKKTRGLGPSFLGLEQIGFFQQIFDIRGGRKIKTKNPTLAGRILTFYENELISSLYCSVL